MRINAWLLLSEDDPESTAYNDPGSAFQSLIRGGVYRAVDMLMVAFVDTVRTGAGTVPPGSGDSYTVTNEPVSHPGGLTNADYMRFVVRDARASNPGIKILATLDWGRADIISRIFTGGRRPAQQEQAFAANLVEFLGHWSLDGFDIDWERPLSDGTSKQQLALLLNAIGSAFRNHGTSYYLTLSPVTTQNLDARSVNDNVAFVNLQLYGGATKDEFTQLGIKPALLAYGAKFEALDKGAGPRDPGDQDASVAYDEAKAGGYTIITQWRLNSGNFEYEQDQQKRLYKLANGAGRTQ